MSYCDRVDYAKTGEDCPLSETCQLYRGHGGDCDARTERERWADPYAHLDGGLPAEKGAASMELVEGHPEIGTTGSPREFVAASVEWLDPDGALRRDIEKGPKS